METIKATVAQIDEKHFINIEDEAHKIRIPLSEDKPSEVKSAFNRLIARIKDGVFQIELAGQQTVVYAEACGLTSLLHLPNQPSIMKGKEAVTWTRLVFVKAQV